MSPLGPRNLHRLRREPVSIANSNRVALAIELSGLRQGEIAEALGWTQSYLSNICRGRFETITVDNAHKLADFFGCLIEDLFPSKQAVA